MTSTSSASDQPLPGRWPNAHRKPAIDPVDHVPVHGSGDDWSRLEGRLLALVVEADGRGWQPVELLRQARRGATRPSQALARLAIAADHRSRSHTSYHQRWLDQIDGLSLPIDDAGAGWLAETIGQTPTDTVGFNGASGRVDGGPGVRGPVGGVIGDDAWSLVVAWSQTPELPCLLPPPAGIDARMSIDLLDATASDPMLDKVRALLAKAEATTFAAEAEAFTAKAHELMARHLIDDALLSANRRRRGHAGSHPITIRLAIDAPYATPKATLIAVVADAGGCRAVHHQSLGLTSVVGHATDVAAVELLFTSLLVQAQSAMHEQARLGEAHRSRGFRSSFLTAFAYRVGERLREVTDDVRRSVEEATGQSLVPVLAERQDEVTTAFEQIFTNVVTRRARRQWDHRGLVSGRTAADRAQLDTTAVRASSARMLPAATEAARNPDRRD